MTAPSSGRTYGRQKEASGTNFREACSVSKSGQRRASELLEKFRLFVSVQFRKRIEDAPARSF